MGEQEPVRHLFGSPAALAEGLAARVAEDLSSAVEERGQAVLALSGGRTPALFLRTLAQEKLDWSRIVATLVDERFVPPQDERSNEKLIRQNLLHGQAAAARLVPLYRPAPSAEAAAALAEPEIAALPQPFDVVVLGMGLDGHTASFFPDAADLERLLANPERHAVLPVHAESAGEPRLTLSTDVISGARRIIVHIEGEEKRRVLDEALQTNAPPIARVLRRAANGVDIYWAP